MEENKILLQKIEIKKIKKRLKNESGIPEKELENNKANLPTKSKVSRTEVLDDTDVEINEHILKIYPKGMVMAGDGNQKMCNNLKRLGKHELNTSEEQKKCKGAVFKRPAFNDVPFESNGSEVSSYQVDISGSSLASQSSFGFYESESSDQEFKYDTLIEEFNASTKETGAKSRNKVQFDNSVKNATRFFNVPVSEKYASHKDITSTQRLAVNNMNGYNSVEEKRSIPVKKHFVINDVKISSIGNSVQIRDSTLSLSVEKDQMKELREALEASTNCLVNYLEKLHKRSLKQNRLKLESDNWSPKPGRNTPKCKYSQTCLKNMDMIIKNQTSDSSLLTAYTLENNYAACEKRTISTEENVSEADSSKSIHMEPPNFENCACDCCNGRCLHSEAIRRYLNGDLSAAAEISKKKITSGMSKGGNLSDNPSVLNTTLKTFQSKSRRKKQDIISLLDPSNTVEKNLDSVTNEARRNVNNAILDQGYNNVDIPAFESDISYSKKPNGIKRKKTEEYHFKQSKEANLTRISHQNNENKIYEEDVNVDVKEAKYDPNTMIFFAILFMISGFCFFLLPVIFMCT